MTSPQKTEAKLFIETDLGRIAVLTNFFFYETGLRSSKIAIAYLQGRSIDYKQSEIAYNSAWLHGESKNHHLVEAW